MAFGIPAAILAGAGISAVADFFGARKNRRSLREAENRNWEMQEQFARNGLRWRIEDATAAGIHPLAAMGYNSPQPSPVAVGDTGVGQAWSNFGQNLGRAITATKTKLERKKEQVENLLLDQQIRELMGQTTTVNRTPNPPFPDDYGYVTEGQSATQPRVVEVPVRRTASNKGKPWVEAAHISDHAYSYTPYGLTIIPGKEIAERIEDQPGPQRFWNFRNAIMPNFPGNYFPTPSTKEYPIPEANRKQGYDHWKWSYMLQQFVPAKSRSKDYKKGREILRKFGGR